MTVPTSATTEPPKRLQVLRRDPPPPEPRAAAPPVPSTPLPRSTSAILGASALVAGGILLVVLCSTLPWIVQPDATGPGRNLDRDELDGAFQADYESALLSRPVVGGVVLAVVGAALLGWESIPMGTVPRIAGRIVLHGVGAFFAYLVALTGMRWLGLYLVALWQPEETAIHLHVVPYVVLVFGLAMLAYTGHRTYVALKVLRTTDDRGRLGPLARRLTATSLLIPLATLLLLPLLPFATIQFGETIYLGEASIMDGSSSGLDFDDVGRDLFWTRAMLWSVAGVSLLAYLAATLEREGRDSRLWGTVAQVFGLNGVLILVGVVFTVLFYVDVVDEVSVGSGPGPRFGFDSNPSYNHLLPVAFLALTGVYAYYLLRVLLPFLAVQRVSAYPTLGGLQTPP